MADNTIISAHNHLAGKKAFQPQRVNNFEVLVDFSGIKDALLDKLKGYYSDFEKSKQSANDLQSVLQYSAIGFDPPHFKQGEIEIKKGNTTIYVADVPSFETTAFKINDFIGAGGKSVFEAWQELSFDWESGGIPDSTAYQIPMTVMEYTPAGEVVNSQELFACWVTGIDEDAQDAENTGKKTVTATIRYNYATKKRLLNFSKVTD